MRRKCLAADLALYPTPELVAMDRMVSHLDAIEATSPNGVVRSRSARRPVFVEQSRNDGSGSPQSQSQASRNVLVIASRFPPVASVGANRIRKFVKYLRQFGWRPVVLTGAIPEVRSCGEEQPQHDFGALGELPRDTPIYRIEPGLLETPDAPGHLICKALSFLSRPFGIGREWLHERVGWRFDALAKKLTIPDRGIWRIHRAVRKALQLHRRYRFNAIFSSGMPFSDHLIALGVRRLIARPWLADFRDPWVEYIHWDQWQSDWGRRSTQLLESTVIRNATSVISVNDHMSRRFAERYPNQPFDKFVTIENGYDDADFRGSSSEQSSNHFRIVYAGSLYATRRPDTILEAFRRFLESTPNACRFARFDFFGRPGPHLDQLSNFSFTGCVRHLGRVSHSEAMQATAQAALNVVILPNLRGGQSDSTAKVYECLGSFKPILAAVPLDGAAAAILRKFDGVSICAPDDIESIVSAFRHWYGRWLLGETTVARSAESLLPLTRRHQAGLLAQCLNEVVASPRQVSGGVRS